MSKPAARIGDMHVCPMVTPGTPPIPHVGGPVTGPGAPTVLIGGMPAAVMGDMCVCTGPPDTIVLGSTGVMIGGKPAARMGDMCAHGGSIVVGCPTVLIGEVSPDGQAGANAVVAKMIKQIEGFEGGTEGALVARQVLTLEKASADGTPFCEVCEAKKEEKKVEEKNEESRPKIKKVYFANEKGQYIHEIVDEDKVFLVIESENSIGMEVEIDMDDDVRDFEYKGQILENDRINISLESNEHRLEFNVVFNS